MNVGELWWERRKGGRFGLWWFGGGGVALCQDFGIMLFCDGVV